MSEQNIKTPTKESYNTPNYVVLVNILNFLQVLPFTLVKYKEGTVNR